MKYLKTTYFFILLAGSLFFSVVSYGTGKRVVKVKLRGVYDSQVKLAPFDGLRYVQPLKEITGMKAGDSVQFVIPEEFLPGEFLFRFDYRAKSTDNPNPAELHLFINNDDIEIHLNPLYLNGDSLRLVNDSENMIWRQFSEQNIVKRHQIGLLAQLLEGFNDSRSPVWRTAARRYESMRRKYNLWIDEMAEKYANRYVGHLFVFQKLQAIEWKLPDENRFDQKVKHWFDNVDLNDTIFLRSRQLYDFINAYVNLFGMKITSEELRDSMFTLAGRLACEKASSGNPRVYGWMVDYFFRGYETYNITSGLQMLEKYINDPRCMTSKKQEIETRIKGIKMLVPGTAVADLMLEDINGKKRTVELKISEKDYQLVVFYDSECGHCNELLADLYKWYEIPQNKAWFAIYSVALDNNREQWLMKHRENAFPWTDLYAPGGVNSNVAASYFVLSTPNMFLIDRDGKLLGLPLSVAELDKFLNGSD